MRSLQRFLALLLILPAMPGSAYGVDTLKKLVFEDCTAALAEAAALPASERQEFISYLGRVLKMQPSSMRDLLVDPPSTAPNAGPFPGQNLPLDELRDLNLWQTFEPSREIEAKRCAAELLLVTAPDSFALLPDVLDVLQEPTLPADLRDLLESILWKVTAKLQEDESGKLDPVLFRMLLQRLGTNTGYIAANLIVELHSLTLPLIIESFRKPDAQLRERLTNLLLRIDSDGDSIGPVLLPLLASGDDDVRIRVIRLLGNLESFYPVSRGALIRRLGDPSADVEQTLYEVLDKVFRKTEGGPVWPEEELADKLLQKLQTETPERREVVQRGLLLFVDTPGIPEKLSALLNSSTDDYLRSRLLTLLSSVENSTPALRATLIESLYDRSDGVRLSAVRALGRLRVDEEERAKAFLRVLKGSSELRDPYFRKQLLLEVADAANGLSSAKHLQRMIPYFVEALSYQDEAEIGTGRAHTLVIASSDSPAARALVFAGAQAVPPLIKALKKEDALLRRRAVWVLARITPVASDTRKMLRFMLKDTDTGVRREAESALVRLGTPAIAEAKAALEWKEVDGRRSAARVLLKLGAAAAVPPALAREAFAEVSCSDKAQFLKDLTTSKPELRAEFQSVVVACLTTNINAKRTLLDDLLEIAPLEPRPVADLAALLDGTMLPAETQFQLIESAPTLGLADEQIALVLLHLFQRGDNSVKQRVLTRLAAIGPAAKGSLPDLVKIYENDDLENILRDKAVVALAAIDPGAVDYTKFFLKELDSDRYQWADLAIREMKPELAVPLLRQALNELKDAASYAVVHSLGDFGSAAIQAKDDLLHLLNNGDPLLRYHATVALLKISPALPELKPALRRELIGKYAAKFETERFTAAVRPLLEEVLVAPETFVAFRAAQELSRRVPPATDSQAAIAAATETPVTESKSEEQVTSNAESEAVVPQVEQ